MTDRDASEPAGAADRAGASGAGRGPDAHPAAGSRPGSQPGRGVGQRRDRVGAFGEALFDVIGPALHATASGVAEVVIRARDELSPDTRHRDGYPRRPTADRARPRGGFGQTGPGVEGSGVAGRGEEDGRQRWDWLARQAGTGEQFARARAAAARAAFEAPVNADPGRCGQPPHRSADTGPSNRQQAPHASRDLLDLPDTSWCGEEAPGRARATVREAGTLTACDVGAVVHTWESHGATYGTGDSTSRVGLGVVEQISFDSTQPASLWVRVNGHGYLLPAAARLCVHHSAPASPTRPAR